MVITKTFAKRDGQFITVKTDERNGRVTQIKGKLGAIRSRQVTFFEDGEQVVDFSDRVIERKMLQGFAQVA